MRDFVVESGKAYILTDTISQPLSARPSNCWAKEPGRESNVAYCHLVFAGWVDCESAAMPITATAPSNAPNTKLLIWNCGFIVGVTLDVTKSCRLDLMADGRPPAVGYRVD